MGWEGMGVLSFLACERDAKGGNPPITILSDFHKLSRYIAFFIAPLLNSPKPAHSFHAVRTKRDFHAGNQTGGRRRKDGQG